MPKGMPTSSVLAAAAVVNRSGFLDSQKKMMDSQIDDLLSRTSSLEEMVRSGEDQWRILLGLDMMERELHQLRKRVQMLDLAQ